ncbi:type II toxin-antitoxin system RelE/ParE family toxin [Povalibacter sp.]|uniref:type II toxin-antitoxin system RelE/ParE family toxin n=1 Tax=Povalibacter sp. TaxID=1962978 RepID=UPI0039C9F973
MTFRPFFRKAARLEYDEAASWYESQRPGLGIEFVSEIGHALLQACEMPQRFPRMLADIRCVRVRRFPYSIFFRVRSDQLVVVSVFHARRDPGVWRERT